MTGSRVAHVPEIDLSAPEVLSNPFTAYARARERFPLARLLIPGIPPMWAMTRYAEARALLTDCRFRLTAESYAFRPEVPEDCRPYLRTMQELDGPAHTRLRRLVSPAFSHRRCAEFAARIEGIVERLLDDLPREDLPDANQPDANQPDRDVPGGAGRTGAVDLLVHLARPLPMEVICEVVGIPEPDRPRWREYGVPLSAGLGEVFAETLPEIIATTRAAIATRRVEPADDLISDLIRIRDEDGDRLSDVELVSLVWNIVLAGQTPANAIANGIAALLTHPEQLAALRADPGLIPGAAEELMRWCGPQLLAVPRQAQEDVDVHGVRIRQGEQVTAALAAANRDPRVFTDPDRLDVRRSPDTPHLGFAHGPHFCLGAALARVQTEVMLTALLRRFPDLALAVAPEDLLRAPDGGTWRLASLPVTL